jgi:hypothetical protein
MNEAARAPVHGSRKTSKTTSLSKRQFRSYTLQVMRAASRRAPSFPCRTLLGWVSAISQQGNGKPFLCCALVPSHASTVADEDGMHL